jgi:hypothetical protein
MHAVGRVDVDQNGTHLGGGELGHGPLVTVRRPDADSVAPLDADGHEGPGGLVDLFDEFPVGPPDALMQADQGLVVRELLGGAVEHLADGHAEQGNLGGTAGVAG